MVARSLWTAALSTAVGILSCLSIGAAESPAPIAHAINESLRGEVKATSAATGPVDDGVFLRRAHLDLVGCVPRPGEITAFLLDPAADKRAKLVNQLLDDPRFGKNWGRYFRDVIMYRKTEDRATIINNVLHDYLAKELNANSPWSKIATDMITASGDALEKGECGLIVAQQGQPEETVAEVSRIFMGVQISCAQCHDHPWDQWKREQFHELAAFFPRVASRLILTPDRRTITVVANDFPRGFGRGPANQRFSGTLEHYMPDLKNPESKGKEMKPVFFATGDSLTFGARDADRRGKLAEWMTKRENPYFAKAFANRLWGELCGEGFYEPLDDIGPDRECSAPRTCDKLAAAFAASNYDVKQLFRVIMATDLYQAESRPRREADQPPFQANVAQRLRSDVILDNLMAVIGFQVSDDATSGPNRPNLRNPRNAFATTFGYDPSQRRDEVSGSILQALAMMNGPQVNASINGNGLTELSRLLREIRDDNELVSELYLRTLGREPTATELKTCRDYIVKVNRRTEAFEDLQWSLINSTEFLYRK